LKPVGGDVCVRMKNDLSAFRYLENQDLEFLAHHFQCKQVEAGETLWSEGDESTYVAFIMEGRVDAKKVTEFKGKQVIVGVYGRGSIVGELGFLDDATRAVTAVALEPSNLLILTRESFAELLEEHPDLGAKLLKGMLLAVSIRLRKSFDRLAAIF